MSAEDVRWVLDVLDEVGVDYLVAGGWGVDALAGRQTRPHDDLDLAIMDFSGQAPRAVSALERLGFTLVHTRSAGIWMPMQSFLDDGSGHRIELLSIDEERLRGSSAAPRGDGTVDRPSVASTGTIAGRSVPCLSADAQLLFHSGYELRPTDERDVAVLRQARPRPDAGFEPLPRVELERE